MYPSDIFRKSVFLVIVLTFVGIPLYKSVADRPLIEKYSEGVMTNVSPTKLSHKGWYWKTWEGWIPLGMTSDGDGNPMLDKWYFSIDNVSNQKEIISCIRNNKRVNLYYTDNIIVPYKLGEDHLVYKCEPSNKDKQ